MKNKHQKLLIIHNRTVIKKWAKFKQGDNRIIIHRFHQIYRVQKIVILKLKL
jgi:hypothetical protein